MSTQEQIKKNLLYAPTAIKSIDLNKKMKIHICVYWHCYNSDDSVMQAYFI